MASHAAAGCTSSAVHILLVHVGMWHAGRGPAHPCPSQRPAALPPAPIPLLSPTPPQDHLKADSYPVKGVPSRFCQRCGQVRAPAPRLGRSHGTRPRAEPLQGLGMQPAPQQPILLRRRPATSAAAGAASTQRWACLLGALLS